MHIHSQNKKGDTLVEVALAIGIFSLVAVAVVAVMNSSTSSTQTALETTLAREEIDTQAEALRFIQSAYIADMDNSTPGVYTSLWNSITGRAIKNTDSTFDVSQLSANPTTCGELYDSDVFREHGFILDPRKLSSGNVSDIFITSSSSKFSQAATYPHLVYGTATSNVDTNSYVASVDSNFYQAQGIYVVAVQDRGSTQIVRSDQSYTGSDSAFYDFYIRTCWYNTSDETPSTISTVIRLYDPLSVSNSSRSSIVTIYYHLSSGAHIDPQYVNAGESTTLADKTAIPTRKGYTLKGWDTSVNGRTKVYNFNGTYTAPSSLTFGEYLDLYPAWEPAPYDITIRYRSDGGTGSIPNQQVSKKVGDTVNLSPSGSFSKANYTFAGWTLEETNNDVSPSTPVSPTTAADGSSTSVSLNGSTGHQSFIAPEWVEHGLTVTVKAKWQPIYQLVYHTNSSWSISNTSCDINTRLCPMVSETLPDGTKRLARSGYEFKGWCDQEPSGDTCPGTSYNFGDNVPVADPSQPFTHIYAVWKARNEKITVKLTFSANDCDSHVEGQRSDNTTFHAYYSNKVGSDVSGLTIAQLDVDRTSGGTETFTINTLGGKNYYYYVRNYSNCNLYTNSTYVTVSGETFSPITYRSNNASGSGGYWNVFAYKDGVIIYKGTRSNEPITNY